MDQTKLKVTNNCEGILTNLKTLDIHTSNVSS